MAAATHVAIRVIGKLAYMLVMLSLLKGFVESAESSDHRSLTVGSYICLIKDYIPCRYHRDDNTEIRTCCLFGHLAKSLDNINDGKS